MEGFAQGKREAHRIRGSQHISIMLCLTRDVPGCYTGVILQVFDRDGNGYLLLDQLKHALTMYGEAFTDEEAEEFFR